jgi:hypothetical protein
MAPRRRAAARTTVHSVRAARRASGLPTAADAFDRRWLARPAAGCVRCVRQMTLLAALLVSLATATFADGGLVRVSRASGPLRITVFTTPTPLRVGPIDISVLVQPVGSDAPLLDLPISLSLYADGDSTRQLTASATHAQATNQWLSSARLRLPAAGHWTATVQVADQSVQFDFAAEPPVGHLAAFWPYLVLPFACVLVFALHQWRAATMHASAAALRRGA